MFLPCFKMWWKREKIYFAAMLGKGPDCPRFPEDNTDLPDDQWSPEKNLKKQDVTITYIER